MDPKSVVLNALNTGVRAAHSLSLTHNMRSLVSFVQQNIAPSKLNKIINHEMKQFLVFRLLSSYFEFRERKRSQEKERK